MGRMGVVAAPPSPSSFYVSWGTPPFRRERSEGRNPMLARGTGGRYGRHCGCCRGREERFSQPDGPRNGEKSQCKGTEQDIKKRVHKQMPPLFVRFYSDNITHIFQSLRKPSSESQKVCIFAARKIKTEYFCNHHIIINKQTPL